MHPQQSVAGKDASSSAGAKPASRRKSLWRDLPVLLVVVFVLALLIKTFLVQAFWIPSGSMEPLLKYGDRVLVNRVVYHLHLPRRGDVIVFSDPNAAPVHRNPASAVLHWMTSGLGASRGSPTDYIKRVIGEPGDTVAVRAGVVFVNGRRLGPEPYRNADPDLSNWGPRRVPADHVFVMGDNRAHSDDSRGSLGFVPIRNVIGRAFVLIWPPGRWHWISTPSYTLP